MTDPSSPMNRSACSVASACSMAFAFCVAGSITAAQAQTYTSYRCENGAQFEVTMFPDTKVAYVQLDGKSIALPKFVSVTGARYRKNGITFWFRGQRATLRRAGVRTECKQQ